MLARDAYGGGSSLHTLGQRNINPLIDPPAQSDGKPYAGHQTRSEISRPKARIRLDDQLEPRLCVPV